MEKLKTRKIWSVGFQLMSGFNLPPLRGEGTLECHIAHKYKLSVKTGHCEPRSQLNGRSGWDGGILFSFKVSTGGFPFKSRTGGLRKILIYGKI